MNGMEGRCLTQEVFRDIQADKGSEWRNYKSPPRHHLYQERKAGEKPLPHGLRGMMDHCSTAAFGM